MLEALSDGRRWSTHELVEYGAGYAAHSRAADLRKLGYSPEQVEDQLLAIRAGAPRRPAICAIETPAITERTSAFRAAAA